MTTPGRSRCSADRARSAGPGRRGAGRRAASIAGALACALLASPTPAQYSGGGIAAADETLVPGISATRPRFSVDATIQPGEGGAPEVRLDYRLPRTELLFERTGRAYRAAYELRVIFYAAKGRRQVTGDLFHRELKAATYSETRLMGQDIVDHVVFRVAPGKYVIEVAITDLVAERTSGTSLEFEVPALPAGQIWFTDLSLGTAAARPVDPDDPRSALDPNPARRFGQDITAFAAYGEIVDARPAEQPGEPYRVQYQVVNEYSDAVFRADTTFARRSDRTPFLLRPRLPILEPGSYRFAVELLSPKPVPPGKKKAPAIRREKAFEVEQSVAALAADPRSSLEVLRILATPDEVKRIDQLKTEEERRTFWEAFWKSRDLTPETPRNEEMDEFYRRVQYSNQQFGVGTAGWKTDMGQVYIKYGEPDEIVRNPFNFDRPPEEIWSYYRHRKTFVFVDDQGFGRYDLDGDRSSTP